MCRKRHRPPHRASRVSWRCCVRPGPRSTACRSLSQSVPTHHAPRFRCVVIRSADNSGVADPIMASSVAQASRSRGRGPRALALGLWQRNCHYPTGHSAAAPLHGSCQAGRRSWHAPCHPGAAADSVGVLPTLGARVPARRVRLRLTSCPQTPPHTKIVLYVAYGGVSPSGMAIPGPHRSRLPIPGVHTVHPGTDRSPHATPGLPGLLQSAPVLYSVHQC